MEYKSLYDLALTKAKEFKISKNVEIGSVGCALINENGHVYSGKNLDMYCSLGMCAERNAISTALSEEVVPITHLICVHKSGQIITPCGACIEFMKQLDYLTKDIKIIISLEPVQTISLTDMVTHWWKEELHK
ncbi:MAG: cytidine deaminase family protein [Bacilli bacterium]